MAADVKVSGGMSAALDVLEQGRRSAYKVDCSVSV